MEYLTPGEIYEILEDFTKTVKKEIETNNVSAMSKEYLIEKFGEWIDAEIKERR